MTRRHLLRLAPIGAGLLVVVVALALPSPRPVAGPAEPPPSGPPRLVDAWPGATVTGFPALLADGYEYQPLVIVDPTTSVGVATSPDLATARVVVRSGDGPVRELRTLRGLKRPTVIAMTVAGGVAYWLENTEGDSVLWRSPLGAGGATSLAEDRDDVLFYGSAYDLQVVDGTVHWASVIAADRQTVDVRSVPAAGGPLTSLRLDGLFALTRWPWVTSSAGGRPGDVALRELVSGETRTVPAGPDEILNCNPDWCRVTTLVDGGRNLVFSTRRAQGGDEQRIGDTARTPLNIDVAALDRFELLTTAAPGNSSGLAQRLWLHDLVGRRAVLLDDYATANVNCRDGFLWWSTGDHEAIMWQVLDLRTLR